MRKATNATLTVQQVAVIKLRLQQGMSARVIATAHDVGLETIRRIARGETWRNVEADPGAYTVEEQMDRELGTNFVPRQDQAALEMAQRIAAKLETDKVAPTTPTGAKIMTLEEMYKQFPTDDVERLKKGESVVEPRNFEAEAEMARNKG